MPDALTWKRKALNWVLKAISPGVAFAVLAASLNLYIEYRDMKRALHDHSNKMEVLAAAIEQQKSSNDLLVTQLSEYLRHRIDAEEDARGELGKAVISLQVEMRVRFGAAEYREPTGVSRGTSAPAEPPTRRLSRRAQIREASEATSTALDRAFVAREVTDPWAN